MVLLNIPSVLPVCLSGFDKYKQTQEVTRALLRLVLRFGPVAQKRANWVVKWVNGVDGDRLHPNRR